MLRDYRASFWERLAGDIRWYTRMAIKALPEVLMGFLFGVMLWLIPVAAGFLCG